MTEKTTVSQKKTDTQLSDSTIKLQKELDGLTKEALDILHYIRKYDVEVLEKYKLEEIVSVDNITPEITKLLFKRAILESDCKKIITKIIHLCYIANVLGEELNIIKVEEISKHVRFDFEDFDITTSGVFNYNEETKTFDFKNPVEQDDNLKQLYSEYEVQLKQMFLRHHGEQENKTE